MNKAAQAYFQTKVGTTDQGQLLLMLYDGALNYLQQARDKMIAKDYAAKGLLISKVIDIVNELSCTLNMEKGGTLAENLNNLYFLCTARLLQANLKMNVEQLDSVSGILSGLRSAYAQILETPEAQKAAAQIATRLNAAASMSQRAAPIMAPPVQATGAAGQMQARAAYGQQGAKNAPMATQSPVAAPSAAPASLVAPVAPPMSAPVAEPAAVASAASAGSASSHAGNPHAGSTVLAFSAPHSAGQTMPKASAPQTESAATTASTLASPSAPSVPPASPVSPAPIGPTSEAQGLSPAGGLSRRMAGYGKFAQGA